MPDHSQPKDSSLSCRGRRLYGPSPSEGAERRAAAFQAFEQSVVLLPSPLHGYGVATVLSTLPPSSVIVAVELEPELNHLSLESSESLLPALVDRYSHQLHYVYAQDSQQLLREACHKLPTQIRRVQLLSLNNGYSLHAQAYRDVQQGIEHELARLWRNRATTLALGPLWVRNLFRNLPLLSRVPRLSTDGRGTRELSQTRLRSKKPVLVVGAGASLEADLDIIRNLSNEVTLVAADSALVPLLGHGVAPDVVVVLEAQPVNREHFLVPFDTVRRSEGNSPFTAFDLSSLPSLAREFAGTGGAVFITRFADISLFDRMEQHGLIPGTVAPVGSVGVCAIMLSCGLFSGPIGITGFDSAYSGGLLHTRGAASHRWALRRSTRLDAEPLFAFRHNRRPIPVTGKEDHIYLSEPNLIGSAERIGELMDSCPRLFDFGSVGLRLGPTVESTETAVRSALNLKPTTPEPDRLPSESLHGVRQHPAPPHDSSEHGSADLTEAPAQTALIVSFLEAEISLLTTGINELTTLEDPTQEHTSPDVLLKLEYLYFDVTPTVPTSTAGRRRALLQAHRYRELLQHALDALSAPS